MTPNGNTARTLAFALILILGVAVVLQYAFTVLLVCLGKTEGLPLLDKIFNDLLPVLGSLAGGATTYYFTRGKE